MMNSIAAVTFAALCAGASVSLFPVSASRGPETVLPAARPASDAKPLAEIHCTQGWPYYPSQCLHGTNRASVVRVISLIQSARNAMRQD
jgi:hypothetical protein